jgi:hypothetical protein
MKSARNLKVQMRTFIERRVRAIFKCIRLSCDVLLAIDLKRKALSFKVKWKKNTTAVAPLLSRPEMLPGRKKIETDLAMWKNHIPPAASIIKFIPVCCVISAVLPQQISSNVLTPLKAQAPVLENRLIRINISAATNHDSIKIPLILNISYIYKAAWLYLLLIKI